MIAEDNITTDVIPADVWAQLTDRQRALLLALAERGSSPDGYTAAAIGVSGASMMHLTTSRFRLVQWLSDQGRRRARYRLLPMGSAVAAHGLRLAKVEHDDGSR